MKRDGRDIPSLVSREIFSSMSEGGKMSIKRNVKLDYRTCWLL